MPLRLIYFLGFLVVCALLLTSIYLQVVDGVLPCPLCALQRFTFVILGILLLIGLLLAPTRRLPRLIIASLAGLCSLIGIALAGRQIWLQHFPYANNNDCGVSLGYMMQVLPLNQLVQKIFQGSTECSKRGWEFLTMNMAEWSLIWFGLFLLLTIYLFLKAIKS